MARPRRSCLGVAGPACLAALCAMGRGFVSAPAAADVRARRPAPHAASGAAAPTPGAALAAGAASVLALAAARPAGASGRRSPLVAARVLPPEEQKGYVGNALGYVNLWTNFMLGFFGSLYGGIVREMAKPGPMKFVIPVLAITIITFVSLLLKAMTTP